MGRVREPSGKNAESFAVHGSTPGDLVLVALVVVFVPSLVLMPALPALETSLTG